MKCARCGYVNNVREDTSMFCVICAFLNIPERVSSSPILRPRVRVERCGVCGRLHKDSLHRSTYYGDLCSECVEGVKSQISEIREALGAMRESVETGPNTIISTRREFPKGVLNPKNVRTKAR